MHTGDDLSSHRITSHYNLLFLWRVTDDDPSGISPEITSRARSIVCQGPKPPVQCPVPNESFIFVVFDIETSICPLSSHFCHLGSAEYSWENRWNGDAKMFRTYEARGAGWGLFSRKKGLGQGYYDVCTAHTGEKGESAPRESWNASRKLLNRNWNPPQSNEAGLAWQIHPWPPGWSNPLKSAYYTYCVVVRWARALPIADWKIFVRRKLFVRKMRLQTLDTCSTVVDYAGVLSVSASASQGYLPLSICTLHTEN